MVSTYDGIVFSPKKKGNPAICNNMEDIMLREKSQSQVDKYLGFHFHEVLK